MDFMVKETGRDKLHRDDAVDTERKFVDPFICQICFYVAQNGVQCGHCKQVFDRSCIEQWLQSNVNCSQCKNVFELEELNRNLVNMFD